ncbi:MAG: signal peptide peptidase SppA [Nanoarchaeota archaeon]
MADYVKLKNERDDDSPKRKKRKSWFSWKMFFLFFFLFFFLSSIISSFIYSVTPKAGIVPINGVILTDKETTLYGTSLSSRDIADTILALDEDTSVKAIILDINSPGGSPVASEEISRAIERAEKPVYAIISETGASGAFWIAMSADKVYASEMSIVGSIGVTSAGLAFEEFIDEYNITYRRLVAGEHKDMGTPFRELTGKEEEKLQNILDEIHENFIVHVAEARNLSREDVEEYATGEIFLGSTGKEAGFIDEFGYMKDLLEDIEAEHGSLLVENYAPETTLGDLLLGLSSIGGLDLFSAQNQILLK